MAKNKMKSHRGACKRLKLTGSGKVKRNKAYKSHILTKKSAKRDVYKRQVIHGVRVMQVCKLCMVCELCMLCMLCSSASSACCKFR